MNNIQLVSGWIKRAGLIQSILLPLACVAVATLVRLLVHPVLPLGTGVSRYIILRSCSRRLSARRERAFWRLLPV